MLLSWTTTGEWKQDKMLYIWTSRARIFKLLRSPRIDTKESIPPAYATWARIFKRLWSPGIDSKASIPPAYVAWRAGTITHIPTRCLAPIDFFKIGPVRQPYSCLVPHWSFKNFRMGHWRESGTYARKLKESVNEEETGTQARFANTLYIANRNGRARCRIIRKQGASI